MHTITARKMSSYLLTSMGLCSGWSILSILSLLFMLFLALLVTLVVVVAVLVLETEDLDTTVFPLLEVS